jgi:hypothetical protein
MIINHCVIWLNHWVIINHCVIFNQGRRFVNKATCLLYNCLTVLIRWVCCIVCMTRGGWFRLRWPERACRRGSVGGCVDPRFAFWPVQLLSDLLLPVVRRPSESRKLSLILVLEIDGGNWLEFNWLRRFIGNISNKLTGDLFCWWLHFKKVGHVEWATNLF